MGVGVLEACIALRGCIEEDAVTPFPPSPPVPPSTCGGGIGGTVRSPGGGVGGGVHGCHGDGPDALLLLVLEVGDHQEVTRFAA